MVTDPYQFGTESGIGVFEQLSKSASPKLTKEALMEQPLTPGGEGVELSPEESTQSPLHRNTLTTYESDRVLTSTSLILDNYHNSYNSFNTHEAI